MKMLVVVNPGSHGIIPCDDPMSMIEHKRKLAVEEGYLCVKVGSIDRYAQYDFFEGMISTNHYRFSLIVCEDQSSVQTPL